MDERQAPRSAHEASDGQRIAWLAGFSAPRSGRSRTGTRRVLRGWQEDDFRSLAAPVDRVAEAVSADGDRLLVRYDDLGEPVQVVAPLPGLDVDVTDRADLATVPGVQERGSALAVRACGDDDARREEQSRHEEAEVARRVAVVVNNLGRWGWEPGHFAHVGDPRPQVDGTFVADGRLHDGRPVAVEYSAHKVPQRIRLVTAPPAPPAPDPGIPGW